MKKQTVLRSTAVLALTMTLGGTLTACGSDDQAADPAATTPSATATPTTSATTIANTGSTTLSSGNRQLVGLQSDPVPNVINIDGAPDSMTNYTTHGPEGPGADTTIGFDASRLGRSITVNSNEAGETRAFQGLCLGALDIVASSRPISPDEWAQCRANGLDIIQFQVAADAVVVAIKSETDVGTDCLSTAEVGQAFERGSTVNRWSDLESNWYNVPFKGTGPGVSTPVARFFGRYVLNNAEPLDSNFRQGYIRTGNELGTLLHVTGTRRDLRLVAQAPSVVARYKQLVTDLKKQWGYYAIADGYLRKAQRQVRLGIKDQRSVKDNNEAVNTQTEAFVNRTLAKQAVLRARRPVKRLQPLYKRIVAAQQRINATRGTAGIFSEGFYATYENRLRPFEIQLPPADDGGRQNCIFPSPQTILNGEYPLSRQLLLTVSTRSLRRPEVKAYLEYYLAHSQQTALATGVVPLPNRDVDRQLGWLRQGPLPTYASVDGGPVLLQDDTTKVVTAPPVTNKPINVAR